MNEMNELQRAIIIFKNDFAYETFVLINNSNNRCLFIVSDVLFNCICLLFNILMLFYFCDSLNTFCKILRCI